MIKVDSSIFAFLVASIKAPRQTANELLSNFDEDDLVRLIWKMVFLACSAAVFAALFSHIISPREYSEKAVQNLPLLKSNFNAFLLTSLTEIAFYLLSFPLSRWIWLKLFGFKNESKGILVALAQTYAFSIAFLIVSALLMNVPNHINEGAASWLRGLQVVIELGWFAYLFTFSTSLNFLKSIWFNALSAAVIIFGGLLLLLIVVLIAVALGWAPAMSGVAI
jgi:hypothetical protein